MTTTPIEQLLRAGLSPLADGASERWQCPHCPHWLEFRIAHEDVGLLGASSHLARQHEIDLSEEVWAKLTCGHGAGRLDATARLGRG